MDGDRDSEKAFTKIDNIKSRVKSKSAKCSHLYMQEKFLKAIPKLSPSKDLSVIYLFNNEIEQIENLNVFPNLTSLYLQNNKIEKMENFRNLIRLKKLYIGRNKISVLEGLETMRSLEELHIEKQDLQDNNPLCIDPRTIFSLSESLCVLNISYNNITTFSYLSPLKNLVIINASFNDLDDIKDVCETIFNWYHLREATFTGNPITKRHRYREEIIANSSHIDTLDGKIVSDVTRKFIKKLVEEKQIRGSKQNVNIADVVPNLPRNYPLALQQAASASILRNNNWPGITQDTSVFNEADAVHIAWRTLPKRKPIMKTPQHLQLKRRNAATGKKRVVINSFS